MIVAKNIYKSFNNLQVLKGVSLQVQEQEIISIVGASGAGKTTLLHILGSLEKPSNPKANQTQILIKDTDLTKLKDSKLSQFRNKNIGFIFQFHQLLPEFTALENVCLPAYINPNKSKKEIKRRAKDLLLYLGLQEREWHKPNALSGGEQQRVSVARALINNPNIVLADEPSGNLDSKNADDLHQLFFDLRENYGQSFVIVTHNKELANMADRKLEMNDGMII